MHKIVCTLKRIDIDASWLQPHQLMTQRGWLVAMATIGDKVVERR